MRLQDGKRLVLDPRPVLHDLVAPRHQPMKPLGVGVGHSDLGQEARGSERGKHPGVDLAGLDLGVRDCLDLQRVGHDHPGNIRPKHPHHRYRVAGRLDHDLVRIGQGSAEAFQAGASHIDPPCRAQSPILPDYHLCEGAVDVHANHTSHRMLLSSSSDGSKWATRQLRIRAHGATG
jgi:hypothetical protein